MNPFRTNDISHDQTVLIETSHLGPGLYSPSNPNDFGGKNHSRNFHSTSGTNAGSGAIDYTGIILN